MTSKAQLSGMRGVYLVAAELTRLGFIVSPTSRSAQGADLLVTDPHCRRALSVQVKTNAATFNYWLLDKKAKKRRSGSHIYVFINLRQTKKRGEEHEFYVVPSRAVSDKMRYGKTGGAEGYEFFMADAKPYKDKWSLFGKSA